MILATIKFIYRPDVCKYGRPLNTLDENGSSLSHHCCHGCFQELKARSKAVSEKLSKQEERHDPRPTD